MRAPGIPVLTSPSPAAQSAGGAGRGQQEGQLGPAVHAGAPAAERASAAAPRRSRREGPRAPVPASCGRAARSGAAQAQPPPGAAAEGSGAPAAGRRRRSRQPGSHGRRRPPASPRPARRSPRRLRSRTICPRQIVASRPRIAGARARGSIPPTSAADSRARSPSGSSCAASRSPALPSAVGAEGAVGASAQRSRRARASRNARSTSSQYAKIRSSNPPASRNASRSVGRCGARRADRLGDAAVEHGRAARRSGSRTRGGCGRSRFPPCRSGRSPRRRA